MPFEGSLSLSVWTVMFMTVLILIKMNLLSCWGIIIYHGPLLIFMYILGLRHYLFLVRITSQFWYLDFDCTVLKIA